MKARISITLSEEVYHEFRAYCQANGMKVSSKIEVMLREALNNASEKAFEGAGK